MPLFNHLHPLKIDGIMIALIGYMASGKSYIGKALAASKGVPFVDLDDEVQVEYLKTSISDFIQQKGELQFRKKEREALQRILQANDKTFVLATGGGTPCYFNNMDLLNQHATTVFLNVSLTTLVNRLMQEKAHRPLISHLGDDELQEFVAKHLFERRQFYMQSQHVLKEDEINPTDMKKVLSL